MIAEFQIRECLARYLSKEISLDQFEDWFAQQSWNMHKDSEPDAQKVAGAVELRLAEHSSGHLDEDSLRQELIPFVTRYNTEISFLGGGELVRPLPSKNQVIMQVFQVAFQATKPLPAATESVDTGREVVFG